MFRNARLIGALLMAAVGTPECLRAQTFYSVDTTTDELVRVDITTGTVTPIGPFLPAVGPVPGVQLAWFDGRLLALMRDGFSSGRLLTFDTIAGNIIDSVPTTFAGSNAVGESLVALDGALHMSVDPNHDTRSERLALLNLDGAAVEVANFGTLADLDGLVQDPATGVIYNLDHDGGSGTQTRLYEVSLDPPGQTLLMQWPNPGLRASDPVIIGDRMYAIAWGPARVLVLDLTPGSVGTLLQTVPLDTDNLLRGLETASPSEPYAFCYGTTCPCGNDASIAGCANSTGVGATLASTGSASVVTDDLVLTALNLSPNHFGLVFMGGGQSNRAPFGDGLLCVSPGPASFCRFSLQYSGAAGTLVEGPGIVALSQSFPFACHIDPGETWSFQAWYRDGTGPCSSSFNLTNAIAVTFSL